MRQQTGAGGKKKKRTLGFMGVLEEKDDPSLPWRGKEKKC